MKIVFDLDGTLIDSKQRLFQLFSYLVPESDLSFDAYWEYKFKGLNHRDILEQYFYFNESQITDFLQQWMLRIEQAMWLDFDVLMKGVETVLTLLKEISSLYICTARQSEQRTLEQLDKLALLKYFDKVMVTQQTVDKSKIIKKTISNLSKQDWIVGDTGHDINAGKILNINTCAVLTGFMSRKSLLTYNPDLIVSDVCKLGNIIHG